MKRVFCAAIAAIVMSSGVQAAPLDVSGTAVGASFSSFAGPGAGTHGLELRGGNNARNGSWELGLGEATSQSGGFSQAQWVWDNNTKNVGQFAFAYDYNNGTSSFSIWDAVNGAPPLMPTISRNFLKTGNALEIFAKRNAEINITEFDGHAVNINIGDISTDKNDTAVFYSEDFQNGFTLAGTMDILGGRDSAYSLLIKAGNVTAVTIPLPAAMPLLLAGLGGLGLIAARRRKNAV